MMLDLLTSINSLGEGTLFKYGLIVTVCIILIYTLIAWIIKKLIFRSIRRKIKVNTKVILRLVKITIYTITIYSSLSLITPLENVLGKIWGSAGILAVVIGLAAQEAMGNFVNGLLITTFKPFKIGDLVKVDNGEYVGYIVDISLRDTVIQTYENTRVIIPNSTMNKAVLENVSRNDDTKGNFLELGISYESDIDKAMKIIQEEVLKHPNFQDPRTPEEKEKGVPPVTVRLVDFQDSAMLLRTTIYSVSNAQGVAMLCDLRLAIKKRFDKEGIEFPYPHRTIHFKNETVQKPEELQK